MPLCFVKIRNVIALDVQKCFEFLLFLNQWLVAVVPEELYSLLRSCWDHMRLERWNSESESFAPNVCVIKEIQVFLIDYLIRLIVARVRDRSLRTLN